MRNRSVTSHTNQLISDDHGSVYLNALMRGLIPGKCIIFAPFAAAATTNPLNTRYL